MNTVVSTNRAGRRRWAAVVAAASLPLVAAAGLAAVPDTGGATAGRAAVGLGVYAGPEGDRGVLAFEAQLGHEVPYVLDYLADGSWADIEQAATTGNWVGKRWQAVYSVPMVPRDGSTLAAGAAGAYDEHWRAFTRSMVDAGAGDAIVRLGWELTGAWYPWGAGTDIEGFKDYWRRIVDTTRAAGGEFRFDWNAGCEPFYPSSLDYAETLPEVAYPGDEWVDLIGCDLYDAVWGRTDLTPEARWDHQLNRRGGLKYLRDFAAAHGKLLTHPEWGLWNAGDQNGGGGDNPYFVQRMHEWLDSNDIGYHAYFNFDGTNDRHSLTGGEFPAAAEEFRRLFGGEGQSEEPAAAPQATTPPGPPTGLEVDVDCGADIGTLTWTPAEGAEGHHVHRDGEQVGPVELLESGRASYRGELAGSGHRYEVRGFNAHSEGEAVAIGVGCGGSDR